MTRLAEIQGHIASMGELLDIVGAMRSLAGDARAGSAARAVRACAAMPESMAAASARR